MPKVVDNYVLERKIGSGQFGDVFKGFRKQTMRDVAVKVIKRENLKGKLNELLENEIKVLRTCNNMNIVKLYDIKKTPNNFYLIMEYCNEGDLADYLKTKKILTEDEAVEMLMQILNAFKTLVKNKILHRDFKPANILKHDGELKIADFGFSKLLSEQDFTCTMLGSPLHMAPEVLGGNEYNNKADIYSIGTVFFEMLYGRAPYIAPTVIDLINMMKKRALIIPKNLNQISGVTEDVLRRMLTLDPKKRISWQELFEHPVTRLLEQKRKQNIEEKLMENPEDIANVSGLYIKENIVIDHPNEISKKEALNNFVMDLVAGKQKVDNIKQQILKKTDSNVDGTLKRKLSDESDPPSEIKTTNSNNELKDDSEDDKSQRTETEAEKNIKIFKRNANKLLHYRNIYVFLASVADDAMTNSQVKISEQVGYLVVRKLLEILQDLNRQMECKENKSYEKWAQFTKQKDFKDIKQYVAKQYSLFTTFHNTILGKFIAKDKIKNFSEDIRDLVKDQNLRTDKTFTKKLKEYIKDCITVFRNKSDKKNWIHIQRILDCLDLEGNFPFESKGEFFNFRQYYESTNLTSVEELVKRVEQRWKKIK